MQSNPANFKMKKLFIILLLASCTPTVRFQRVGHWYHIVKAEQVNNMFRVHLKEIKRCFVLPPPEGKTKLVAGDSINIVFIERVR